MKHMSRAIEEDTNTSQLFSIAQMKPLKSDKLTIKLESIEPISVESKNSDVRKDR